MKIFSGSANLSLAEKLAHALGIAVSPRELFIFPDGERRVQIQENVVDEDTIIVQPTSTPVDQNYMELFFLADGLKRSGASSITAVIPYLGYQRQDHVFRDGEAVSLEVIAKMLHAVGIEKIVACDLHSVKIPEVFAIPMEDVSALPLFAEVINPDAGPVKRYPHPTSSASLAGARRGTPTLATRSSVLVSPDLGGLRRIKILSELLDGMPWIATVKDRDVNTGKIAITTIEGDADLQGKHAFIVDDMISSGKTMVESAKLLRKHGAQKVSLFATHAIFSQRAPERLQQADIEKVYVTDSVFVPEEKRFAKLEIVSIAPLLAKALKS